MKKEKLVNVCPECGSTNVGPGISNGLPPMICNDCGYGNMQKEEVPVKFKVLPGYAIFPEIEESKVKKFQKALKKKIK